MTWSRAKVPDAPAPLHRARIPLTVQVPIIVAALTILVAAIVSQIVLQRLAKEQSTSLASLSSAFMDGLTTAVTPGLLTRDAWETFDALDRAREQYEAVHAVFNVVLLPSGEVLAASDPARFPIGSHLPAGHRRNARSRSAGLISR